ncbi:restriction endonuclease subunit S [Alistipes sp. An66]|uniref:restriction endonuclease subunit S n=1 Tax=Alistipes sp. An66 TaxID=1965650 RepID=UPI000B391CEA|nr:restriction endonuclease subunit S [Alistipes sp. An66]OUN58455.1 restriction endonuclease subunit S [Alistipes sp. An66]
MLRGKRLGDYIREVDVRNRDLSVTQLLGVSITKEFMPSIANTIGTDMSTYKIVKAGQFAYGPVTSRNGDKISIALLSMVNPVIISQAYTVFEVKNTDALLPAYLMMWFRRPEFDRYARFHSHGSAREIFDWTELCDVQLPVPSIERQRAMVAEYETLSRRIDLNRSMIAQLEATAQTLYRKMFVDDIDPEHLPTGWRMGTIGEFCKEMTSGGTPSRTCSEYWNSKDYRWLKTGEVQNNIIFDTEEYISEQGLKNSSAKLIPINTVIMAMYGGGTVGNVAYLQCETATNQACCNMICFNNNDAAYLYFHLRYYQEKIKRLANGGAQENLSQEIIAQQPILILEDGMYIQPFVGILNQMIVKTKEIIIITKLQSLLLAKMGQ